MEAALVMNRRKFLRTSLAIAAISIVPVSLTGCNTDWITTAENDLPTITNILDSLLGIIADATGNGVLDSVGEAALNAAIGIASAGLITVSNLIADYKVSPSATLLQKIQAMFADAQQNLSAILSTIKVSDPNLVASITEGVNLAVATVSAIQLLLNSLIPSTGNLSAKAKTSSPKITLMTNREIAIQYNAVISAHQYQKHTIKVPLPSL